ncbi:Proprotein convertase subtilisin/kexin type 5, partial [Lemmus lemmus]
PGFYGDQELGECQPCHRACETCTGLGYNQCGSCQEGLQLWHGACIWPTGPQAGEGKFWNDATKQYQPCHSSCKTCDGSETLCTSCPSGTYLWLQTCVPSCPQG